MKTHAIVADRFVLLLNRNWQAIASLKVEQAEHRLVSGTARVLWIDEDHFQDLDWSQWKSLPVRENDPVIGTVRGLGGANSCENCVLSGKSVNRRKAARTPDEAGLKLLSQPQPLTAAPSTLRISNVHNIAESQHLLVF